MSRRKRIDEGYDDRPVRRLSERRHSAERVEDRGRPPNSTVERRDASTRVTVVSDARPRTTLDTYEGERRRRTEERRARSNTRDGEIGSLSMPVRFHRPRSDYRSHRYNETLYDEARYVVEGDQDSRQHLWPLSDIGSESDYSLSLDDETGENKDPSLTDPLIANADTANNDLQCTVDRKLDFTEVRAFPTKYGPEKMAVSILVEDNQSPLAAGDVALEKMPHPRKSTSSAKAILFRWL